MPRPTNKEELISAANSQYEKLMEIIESLTLENRKKEFNFDAKNIGKEAHWMRDKNIRDVLIHLYEWHMLLINWIDSNKKGIEKPFLIAPYNWKNYGDMNIKFWEHHQNTSYDNALEMLDESHKKVTSIIKSFSDDELFTKKYFIWTGNTSLGSYCISSTSSHYEWAIKKIKLYRKSLS